jgi:hypothetical protein
MSALFHSIILFWSIASAAQALTIHFDDLDASSQDIDLTGSAYHGYVWTNFSAYISLAGFDGFNHGVVSTDIAAYGGGETSNSDQNNALTSTLSANTPFDLTSAYFNAVYYDNLDVIVEGLLDNRVLFSKSVSVSTTSFLLVNFDFNGINRLNFWSVQTESTINPFGCTGFNCTQFTVDNLNIQDASSNATAPEPPLFILLCFGVVLIAAMDRRYR